MRIKSLVNAFAGPRANAGKLRLDLTHSRLSALNCSNRTMHNHIRSRFCSFLRVKSMFVHVTLPLLLLGQTWNLSRFLLTTGDMTFFSTTKIRMFRSKSGRKENCELQNVKGTHISFFVVKCVSRKGCAPSLTNN